jgi:hypothetical protein
MFAEKCTGEYREEIHEAVNLIGVDDIKLGTASALVEKTYPLDPNNLTGSYFEQLERAVEEFCCSSDLVVVFNNVFEEAYEQVFDKEPNGEHVSPLAD